MLRDMWLACNRHLARLTFVPSLTLVRPHIEIPLAHLVGQNGGTEKPPMQMQCDRGTQVEGLSQLPLEEEALEMGVAAHQVWVKTAAV